MPNTGVRLILVLGGENVCRSPLGAVLLGRALTDAGREVAINSAGLWTSVRQPVDAFTELVAQRYGISLADHSARHFTAEQAREADLILVMENRHRIALQKIAADTSTRVCLFDHWLGARGIPDPRDRSLEFYQAVHSLVSDAAAAWAEVINSA